MSLLGLKLPRVAALLTAVALLLVGVVLAAFYFHSLQATLRITTGPAGGVAERFISAFVSTTQAEHPRIRFETVAVPDLKASSKALEDGKVNIAVVRSDVATPVNGQSLMILRRDVVTVILPPGSPIKSFAQLSGKTVAVPLGPVQAENAHALDLILGYFNVNPESVKRVFLPLAEIGHAVREKRAAAVLAVGPIGPGQVGEAVAAVAKATRGTPEILGLDESDAIAKRFPGLEEIDIPKGAFKGRPAIPDDDIKGLSVTYRFAVPTRMLNAVAGALARSILKTKGRLMALTPLAAQIQAPDPDEDNPILPIHPGVAAYLSSGDQSFLDDLQTYVYAIGIPLSLLGSLIAVLWGFVTNRRLQKDQERVFRLLVLADEASKATPDELAFLEREFRSSVSACVSKLLEDGGQGDHAPVALAIDHARRAIEERKAAFAAGASTADAGPISANAVAAH
jgi:TRAP-type uncharacterized transport system substrate-binding protein